jgi:hypothetical protein
LRVEENELMVHDEVEATWKLGLQGADVLRYLPVNMELNKLLFLIRILLCYQMS